MKLSNFTILFSLWFSINGFAQSDIPVGTWRTHNSYNSLVAISNTPTSIYAASSTALFSYNVTTREVMSITSLSGLNDADITDIDFNFNVEKMVIAYRNGNIDILQDNRIINFPDLLNAEISGSKEIHQIFNYQQRSYLCTDFGLMIIDLDNMQVKDTYFELGPSGQKIKVYNATIAYDSLFLATELGIMRGSLQDNLKDFNQWKFFGPSAGLPNTTAKVLLSTPSGLLTAIDDSGIFEYDGNSWLNKNSLTQSIFIHGSQAGNSTLLTTTDTVYEYLSGNASPVLTAIGMHPKASIYSSSKTWIADNKNGLVNADDDISIYPNGPYSGNIIKLYSYQDKVIAMPPAYDNNFQPLRNKDGFCKFADGAWKNFNSTGYPKTVSIPEFYDVSGAAYAEANKSLYLSSFGYGLLQLQDQASNIIDENNSSLINVKPPGRNVLVSAIDVRYQVLSTINFSTFQPLHLYDIEYDSWQVNAPTPAASSSTQIVDVGNDIYWLRVANSFGGGIKIYDTANSRELYLTTGNGSLPANEIFDLVLDREGKMWVATKKGVIYFHQPEYIFDNGIVDPVFPIFDGQILFKGEKISALAVDGGNRVWMGTSGGLWLFADDGQQEIAHFTADKDPIPSNDILDIAINQENGEVFVATANGLVSYRGTSTTAGQRQEVKIFPNPALIGQHDIITIEGVPENASVSITDASGRLLFKTQANGNTAIWPNLGSQSLSTGIYFVFIANDDGSEKQIGKIALIY